VFAADPNGRNAHEAGAGCSGGRISTSTQALVARCCFVADSITRVDPIKRLRLVQTGHGPQTPTTWPLWVDPAHLLPAVLSRIRIARANVLTPFVTEVRKRSLARTSVTTAWDILRAESVKYPKAPSRNCDAWNGADRMPGLLAPVVSKSC
jgi:hypothetical protein